MHHLWVEICGLEVSVSGWGSAVNSCKDGNGLSGSIKGGVFLD
jgi:hypothetical protein